MGWTELRAEGDDVNITFSGIGTYQNTQKQIYEITGAVDVYLVYNEDIDSDTSDFTNRHRVALHEMTHAFGFFGHTLYPSQLMYLIPDPVYGYSTGALSTNERNHLKQIYDYQT